MEDKILTGRFKCPKCKWESLGLYIRWYKKIIGKTEKYQIQTDLNYTTPPLFQTVEEINKKNLKCSKCEYKPSSFVEFMTKGKIYNPQPNKIFPIE